jgi:hypothetical protein
MIYGVIVGSSGQTVTVRLKKPIEVKAGTGYGLQLEFDTFLPATDYFSVGTECNTTTTPFDSPYDNGHIIVYGPQDDWAVKNSNCDFLFRLYNEPEAYAMIDDTGIANEKASFGVDKGSLSTCQTTAIPDNPPGDFPHGFFQLNASGLESGEAVTFTIAFYDDNDAPINIEAGKFKWWKYDAGTGQWFYLDIGDDDGDHIITVTITDGGLGDLDNVADGDVEDPGGLAEVSNEEPAPLPPLPSGGTTMAVPTLNQWGFIVFVILLAGSAIYFIRRGKRIN